MSLLPRRPLRAVFILCGLWSLVLYGCPGSLDPALRTPGVCNAPATVFDRTPNPLCTQLGCHSANTPAGGLDLTNNAGLVGRLLGVRSNGMNTSVCGAETTPYLVDGMTPATGLLLDKMFASPLPCGAGGNRMPSLGALSQADTDCIREWANSVTAP
jgi:hypothetical protein